jgi:hypothetical protein
VKLIALLNWYEENDAWLRSGIRSLAKAPIDHVVAVDGAYAMFPDGHAQSPPSNAETIQSTCDELGIGCTIHTPTTVWEGNEVEKRTFMFRLADEIAEPNVDWFLVWDTDQHLGRCSNLKPRLAATHLDAGDVRVIEPKDPRDGDIQYHPGTGIPKPQYTDVRLLYRAIPGIYCDRNHFTYTTPDGRRLWGNPNTHTLVPGVDLSDVQVLHKTRRRIDSRGARRLRYYRTRDSEGIEDTTCSFCGAEGLTQGIAHNWEWVKREEGGWLLSGGLAPACPRCAVKHGTSKARPMVLKCPECNGKASRRNPCRFCGTKGYKLHDPNEIQMHLRPSIVGDGRVGNKAETQ